VTVRLKPSTANYLCELAKIYKTTISEFVDCLISKTIYKTTKLIGYPPESGDCLVVSYNCDSALEGISW
jgi:hypothetical protein